MYIYMIYSCMYTQKYAYTKYIHIQNSCSHSNNMAGTNLLFSYMVLNIPNAKTNMYHLQLLLLKTPLMEWQEIGCNLNILLKTPSYTTRTTSLSSYCTLLPTFRLIFLSSHPEIRLSSTGRLEQKRWKGKIKGLNYVKNLLFQKNFLN